VRTALAVLRRDWAVERTYHLKLGLSLIQTAGFAFALYFVSKLVDDPEALSQYDGTYFDFVMVGLAVNFFAAVGLESFSTSLVREQNTGTIELLLVSPVRSGTLVAGMFLFPLILGVIQVVALLGVGMGLAGSGISVGGLLLATPVMALTTATFAAVGIAAAGVLILAKRGDPLTGPFSLLSMLFSGAIFPLDVLPGWIQPLGYLIPAAWGVRATREILLSDAGWQDVLPEVIALALFSVVFMVVGLRLLRRCLEIGRRDALLGGY
jgi:ABC-2 type transport system permease protein